MKLFTKRLLALGLFISCFATATFALSQAVSYKPWGVPDSKLEQYEQTLEQLSRQAQQREAAKGKPSPQIRITPTLIDLGWVAPGESMDGAMRIENLGDADLKVAFRSNANPLVKTELKQPSLAPEEHSECRIRLTAAAHRVEGIQKQSVTLVTNDPRQSTLTVVIKYRQKSALVVPSLIKLGSHDIDESVVFEFDAYSQLSDRLEIKALSCEGFDVDWVAESADVKQGELRAQAAASATRFTVRMQSKDYGSYSGALRLVALVDGQEQEMEIPFNGRTKPPIGFYGPNVDMRTGVDFGTRESGTRHDLYVTVRSRADKSRAIAVLAVEPRELQTELTPLKTRGSYRLRISIPADCPDLRFNLDQKRGYVEIGDPDSETYSSWLPVYGAVSKASR